MRPGSPHRVHNFIASANRALAAMGMSGMVALGLLVFCAGFYASWIAPRQEQVRALEARAGRLQRGPRAAAPTPSEQGPLGDFYDFFPAADAIPKTLDRLFALAQRNGLDIAKSEYRLVGSIDTNMTTYQVRFPLNGTYDQLRKFIAAALQEFPFASLDELHLEKKRVEDAAVESQIRFSFYLRVK
jgi:hypothetical protein